MDSYPNTQRPSIVQDRDPVLRHKAVPVPETLFGTKELDDHINRMAEALDGEPDGVALAAPQIGLPWRMFIVRTDRTKPPAPPTKAMETRLSKAEIEVYINPEIIRKSRKKQEVDEGCLSVRGYYGLTKRSERATVRAYRPDGTRFERGAGGLLAQIFEHEVDHLEGVLFTDHATSVVRVANPGLRFAYFGTPYVARDTLATLIEHGFVPTVVVTNPNAPKGRGHVLTPSDTKILALEHNIPVLTPEKLTPEFVSELSEYECDLALVVAYGKILPESLLRAFPKGVLNVHYSLLPKYRGASPVESALLHGETITGVTIQKMTKELDAGDIIAVAETPIGDTESTKELRPRLVALGAKLLVETLPRYLAGESTLTPQDHAQATRAPKFKKEDGELDLAGDAKLNWRKYRAFAEGPGTYFFKDGPRTSRGQAKRYKITKATFKDGAFIVERVIPEGARETDYMRE